MKLRETIEDMDKNIEVKDNKFKILADISGVSSSEIIKPMEKVKPGEKLGETDRVIETSNIFVI